MQNSLSPCDTTSFVANRGGVELLPFFPRDVAVEYNPGRELLALPACEHSHMHMGSLYNIQKRLNTWSACVQEDL